jgi:hypothetical protein
MRKNKASLSGAGGVFDGVVRLSHKPDACQSHPMFGMDQLMSALFLLALLLYLLPSVFGLGERRLRFQRGAILTLGVAIAIAQWRA